MNSAPQQKRRAEWLIVAAFAIVVGVGIIRHEMWRDELQAWMIARASDGFFDLFDNLAYEGHPFLWYAVIWPFARLSSDPHAMQVLQWAIAVASMIVIARFSPFSIRQKALLAGSYFILFEYGVLARSYGLGLLLTVVICAAVARTPRPWIWIGAAGALLTLTSAFGAVIAAAVASGLAVDEWLKGRRDRRYRCDGRALAALAIWLGTCIAAAISAAPPRSARFSTWNTSLDADLATSVSGAAFRAVAPVPKITAEFWGTHMLDGWSWLAALAGVTVLAIGAWLLRVRPGSLVVFVVGAGGTLALLYFKLEIAVGSRHYGHVFIAFLAALWLAPSMSALKPSPDGRSRQLDLAGTALSGVLIVQVIAAAFVVASDLARPFSRAEDAATLVETEGVVVVAPPAQGSGIAAFADRAIIHFPPGTAQTFVVWDSTTDAVPTAMDIAAFGREHPDSVLVVPRGFEQVDPWFRFAGLGDAIVPDESFWLYRSEPVTVVGRASGSGG